jgi:GH24 family phage-related lysozyme (muramidase)
VNVTLTDDDFEIRQNPDNTVTIVRLKFDKFVNRFISVVIPGTIYGLPVTAIADNAFRNTGRRRGNNTPVIIISVVIPDTVTTIGVNAFNVADGDDSQLRRVVLGKGVRNIGSNAFARNPSLTAIIIPDSVTGIEDSAFEGCGLTSVTMGSGLRSIGNNAFADNQLTSLTLPAGLANIGNGVFANNQLTSVNLDGITSIGSRAFAGNRLTSVTLPAGITSIGAGAFEGNRSPVEPTTPTEPTTRIRTRQDSDGSPMPPSTRVETTPSIQSVTIPAGIRNVGSDVFQGSAITRITLPANVSDSDLRNYNFEANFITFYGGQGRVAGTYTKNGPIWARSTAGGID